MSTFFSGAKKPKLKDYPTAAAKWIVNTYGTLSSVEDPSFREMILTLNADAPNLSNKRMLDVVHQMNAEAKLDLRDIKRMKLLQV